MTMPQPGVLQQEHVAADLAPDTAASTPSPLAAGIGFLPTFAVGGAPLRRHGGGHDVLGGTEVDPHIVQTLRRRQGAGAPLPREVADPFGSHFGQDFAAIRIHHDSEAGSIASGLQATAFTHGNDIYFAPGAYRPGSADGQRVIAHELSHVVAQRTGADRVSSGPLEVGQADDPAEAAADRSADGAMAALRRFSSPVEVSDDGPARADAPVMNRAVPPELRRSVSDLTPAESDATVEVTPAGNAGSAVGTAPPHATLRRFFGLSWLWGGWSQPVSDADAHGAPASAPSTAAESGPAGQRPETAASSGGDGGSAQWWAKKLTGTPGDLLAAFIKERSAEATYVHGHKQQDADDDSDAVTSFEGESVIGRKTGYEGTARGEIDDLRPSYEAALEAFAQFGAENEYEAKLLRRMKHLEFMATGTTTIFGGFRATGEATAKVNQDGLELGAEGDLKLGVMLEQTGEVSLDIPLGEISAEGTAHAELVAALHGEGNLTVDWQFTELEATADLEAFAGGRASAEAEIDYRLGAVQLFSLRGKASVGYGWGGAAGVSFRYKDGHVTWETKAFASNFLGGGIETGGSVNVKELTDIITGAITAAYVGYAKWLRGETGEDPREPHADVTAGEKVQQAAYEVYLTPLRHQAADRGRRTPERKPVQMLLNRHRPKLGDAARHSESDIGIMQAIKDAYGDTIQEVTVAAGKIGTWSAS